MDKTQILECLKAPEKLAEIKEAIAASETAGPDQAELFLALLKEAIGEVLLDHLTEDEAKDIVAKLAAAEETEQKIVDPDLMAKVQDEAVALVGDWNEEAAALAVSAYLLGGGEFESPEEVLNEAVTVGSLFGLEAEDPMFSVEAKLTTKQRKSLPDSAYCGPGRSFPVNDKAHAVAALRMIDRYKGPGDKEKIRACIMRRASKFGVGGKESAVVFTPILIEADGSLYTPLVIESAEAAKQALTHLAEMVEAYGLSEEEAGKVETFLQECVDLEATLFGEDEAPLFAHEGDFAQPLVLGPKFLLEYFTKHDATSSERETLAALVGLIRKEGVTQEAVEKSKLAYGGFGVAVLKKLLTAPAPTASTSEAEETPDPEPEQIETIPDPTTPEEPQGKTEARDQKPAKRPRVMEAFKKRRTPAQAAPTTKETN